MKIKRLGQFTLHCNTEQYSDTILSPKGAADFFRKALYSKDYYDPMKEFSIVICLSTKRKVIGWNLVSMGQVDSCTMHPRETFRPAIACAAKSLLLAHSHPSDNTTPSGADVAVTRRLIEAGKIIDIEITDHVIVGPTNYTSLRSLGYFGY